MEYRTTDIILAACLRLYNHEMVRIEINGSKGTFVFEDADGMQILIDDYDLGKVRVEPVSFNNMIKQLTTSVRRMTQKI